MKHIDIACFGLTRMQMHTLRCHFPIIYDLCPISSETLCDDEKLELLVQKTYCAFINPKALEVGQLQRILAAHEYATQHTAATMLLFTDAFTAEQKGAVDTKSLHRVNLRRGRDFDLKDVVTLVKKARMPCFSHMDEMKSNMFNDGWYLMDLETSGLDWYEDEIISLSIAYMVDYEIEWEKQFYIKPSKPAPEDVERITGITNEMLEDGVSRETVVDFIMNLPVSAPIICYSGDYYASFWNALLLSGGKREKFPMLFMSDLAALVFGYMKQRATYEILPLLQRRKYRRSHLENEYLQKLCDLTLAVFESLQERYDIHGAGELCQLYED